MELFKLFGRIAVDNDEANSNIDETTKKAEQAKLTLSSMGEGVTRFGDGISKVGMALMPVSAAIGGVGVSSGKMALDFENAMAKVSTIADTSEVSIEDMGSAIMKLSNDTGIASTDIADNVYNAISAGQKTGDAVNFVSKATQLAKAGFTDSASALDILSTVMNAYGLEADQVEKVSNNLIMTQNLGKTTVGELASSMGKIIPTAKSVGVNLDTLSGAYAVMTSSGIATAETTTYMNSMLNELGKKGTTAATAFAEGTKHIKEGGLSMQEAMERGWSLTDVLSILDEQANLSGTSIQNLFGSAEAGRAAYVLWDNAVKLNDAVEQMGNSAGATQDAFDKMNTTSFNLQKTINEVKNTGIELGTTLISTLSPYITQVSEKVHSLCDWFNNLDDEQRMQIIRIGAIVGAIAPLLLGIGKVISLVGKIMTIIPKVRTGIHTINLVLSANPIGAVVVAIGLLVAAFTTLWNTNEQFRESITNTFNQLKEKFSGFVDGITERMDGIKEAFSNIIEFITAAWNVLCEFLAPVFEGVWQGIVEFFSGILDMIMGYVDIFIGLFTGDWDRLWQGVKELFEGTWNAITGFASGIWNGIQNLSKIIWENIKTSFVAVFTAIKDFFVNLWNGIKATASNIWNGIKNKASEIWNGIKTTFVNTWNSIKTIAATTWENIKTTIMKPIESARDKIKSIVETIKGFFNFTISFPSVPLPHFSISPSGWSVGDLLKGSIPRLGIEWYAKAMDEPYMFVKPTIMGDKGFGDAGDEIVYGRKNLMEDIRNASQPDTTEVQIKMNKIITLLEKLLEMDIRLDSGALVGGLAPAMDSALGNIYASKERGGRSTW